jgi:imidazolonepropionase-like amidohydrolase
MSAHTPQKKSISWIGYFGIACAMVGSFIGYKANAQTVAITDGLVAIGDGDAPIIGATVLMRDGKIIAVGTNVVIPANAERIDAKGKWVTPGLFAGFSRLGLSEIEGVDPTNDISAAKSPFSAVIDAEDSINPRANAIAVSRQAGITRAVVAPDNPTRMFGGFGAVIDTSADFDVMTKRRAFQYVDFGETGAAEAGGSRSASFAYFRNAITEVREYAQSLRPMAMRPHDTELTKADMAALLPVLKGEVPLMVRVESAVDIRRMLALKREFPSLDMIIVGATEGWEVATEIAAAKVPVVVYPMNDLPDSFEMLSATQSNAGRLEKAGVKMSFGQIGRFESLQVRLLTQHAGNMVALAKVPGATGMTWGQALNAITLRPAQMMGLGNELGSLTVGKRADVVLWDGDPLELGSAVVALWIDGTRQPIKSRQDKLRDRYLKPSTGALPKAYEQGP